MRKLLLLALLSLSVCACHAQSISAPTVHGNWAYQLVTQRDGEEVKMATTYSPVAHFPTGNSRVSLIIFKEKNGAITVCIDGGKGKFFRPGDASCLFVTFADGFLLAMQPEPFKHGATIASLIYLTNTPELYWRIARSKTVSIEAFTAGPKSAGYPVSETGFVFNTAGLHFDEMLVNSWGDH